MPERQHSKVICQVIFGDSSTPYSLLPTPYHLTLWHLFASCIIS
jgi:hypothetical protein